MPPLAEGSADVRARVAAARERYRALNDKHDGGKRRLRTNAEADGELLEEIAAPDADGRALLAQAAEKMKLSARGYHRVLRVARTLRRLGGGRGRGRPGGQEPGAVPGHPGVPIGGRAQP